MSSPTRRGAFAWLPMAALTVAISPACSPADDHGGPASPSAGVSGTPSTSAGAGGTPAGRGGDSSAGGSSGQASSGAGTNAAAGSAAAGNGGGRGGNGSERGGAAGRVGADPEGGSSGTVAGGGASAGEPNAAGMGSSESGVPTLFWLDVGGTVLTSAADPFEKTTLVSDAGDGPDGIAVDVAGGHVFWTNMGNTAADDGYIRRADLDGKNVTTIVPAGGTFTPKQMKLEPVEQKLYWSDREGMRVQRASIDGSSVETLYTSAKGDAARKDLSNHCVGIAVDLRAGFFYWSQKGPDNGGVGSLRRAHLAMPAGENDENRSDVEILYDGLPEPIDIDLDTAEGMIYWTDRGDDTINRGPIELPSGSTAKTRTDREIIVHDVSEAIGIFLDLERGLVYYTGAKGQVGRAHLDGSGAEYLMTMPGAFTGIQVVDLPP